MQEQIIFKKNPRIEFRFQTNGFQLIDQQTVQNSGFYSYRDIESIRLNKVWFPKLAKWLRIVTALCNGVPFFPDAASCKKATVIIHFRNTKLGMWLTDPYMADKARVLKKELDHRTKKTTPGLD
ncbi:hypothetical protein ACFSTE_17855 [Aquimarina hainanensis]|uniref:Uncharacterized protein n=1 Tax=Aquimarina hainanensis TaxID=1578017 RepID=A0ABW5NBT8_9FLAO